MSAHRLLAVGVTAVAVAAFYLLFGFYTIQPIGAVPDGRTLLVWRNSGEPFFNSADGTCLRIQDGVSLFCRMGALANAPIDRIVLRLPYSEFAYLRSTNGQEFDR